ncbi:hypothetical protein BDR05DRAFT_97453 [Suillus weaverae]|nr:hypothetical protein BDR05DRAFT_97453 [Suillus weaverae]
MERQLPHWLYQTTAHSLLLPLQMVCIFMIYSFLLTSLFLPTSAPRSVNTMTFHPHVRTRLLLGLGCDILVYDVSRPSAHVKPINIGQDVVGISCSPFSKPKERNGAITGRPVGAIAAPHGAHHN